MNMPRIAQALENSPEGSHRLPPELAGENRAVPVPAGAGGDSAVCCWVTRWQLCGLAGVPLGPVSSGKRSSLRQMYLNCSEFLGILSEAGTPDCSLHISFSPAGKTTSSQLILFFVFFGFVQFFCNFTCTTCIFCFQVLFKRKNRLLRSHCLL